MSDPVRKAERPFTYKDYLGWPDDERWELIGGVAYAVSPAASTQHQRILMELSRQIANFLLDKPCEVFPAPFDVRLPASDEAVDEARNVVQPDISVICHRERLDARGCRGAPDLVVEILSPDSGRRDLKLKLELYERSGVPEYWIVHPEERVIQAFRRGPQGSYDRPEAFGPEDTLASVAVEGLKVELAQVLSIYVDPAG